MEECLVQICTRRRLVVEREDAPGGRRSQDESLIRSMEHHQL